MLNFYLYDMAKVREQEFVAQAARRRNRQANETGLVASVAKLLRRRESGEQH